MGSIAYKDIALMIIIIFITPRIDIKVNMYGLTRNSALCVQAATLTYRGR